jgi:hypothetical protein
LQKLIALYFNNVVIQGESSNETYCPNAKLLESIQLIMVKELPSLAVKRDKAIAYLAYRGRHVMGRNNTFCPTSSKDTDIKKTMLQYIMEEMPDQLKHYGFLLSTSV